MTRKMLIPLLSLGAAVLIGVLALASCGGGGLKALTDGAALLARNGSGVASPWRMFGKNSLCTRLSEHTGPPTNKLKWKYSTTSDVGMNSPAIAADGTIYIGDAGAADKAPKLYAVSSNGKLKWSFTSVGNLSSPAISADGSTIYAGGSWDPVHSQEDRNLYAISSSGSLRWTFETSGRVFACPAIGDDGTIYLTSAVYVGSNVPKLYALNPDGSLKWDFAIIGDDVTGGVTSPALGGDGAVYFGAAIFVANTSSSGKVFAVNPDGSLRWEYSIGGYPGSPAVVPGGVPGAGTIYVRSRDSMDESLQNETDQALYAFNPDGTLKWRHATEYGPAGAPAIGADGTVYTGTSPLQTSSPGTLYAINPDNTEAWALTLGSGIFSSPALGADGTIYVAESNRKFYAVNSNGTVKWTYNLSGRAWSSPAIGGDGTVYIGSDGIDTGGSNLRHGLYAIGPGLN